MQAIKSMLGMGDEGEQQPQPQLSEGRGMAARPDFDDFQHSVRDFLQDRVVTVVRWRQRDTGKQMKISVADEDALIEQGDARAAAQSEEVHEDIRPDLGGWTGGLVWEASQVLARLLIAQSAEFWRRHSRVGELGCGCGLVGLTAAALGAEEVTLTDQVLFVAEHNRKHGGLDREAQERVSVRKLKWGDEEDIAALRPPVDLVLGSDIMYYTGARRPATPPSSTPPCLASLTLSRSGGSPALRLALAPLTLCRP